MIIGRWEKTLRIAKASRQLLRTPDRSAPISKSWRQQMDGANVTTRLLKVYGGLRRLLSSDSSDRATTVLEITRS